MYKCISKAPQGQRQKLVNTPTHTSVFGILKRIVKLVGRQFDNFYATRFSIVLNSTATWAVQFWQKKLFIGDRDRDHRLLDFEMLRKVILYDNCECEKIFSGQVSGLKQNFDFLLCELSLDNLLPVDATILLGRESTYVTYCGLAMIH